MNKVFAVLAVVGIFLFILAGSVVSHYNGAVRFEALLEAKYQDTQNVLSNYAMKVSETVQVTKMYSADFQKVVKESIQGRYGEGGAKAVMTWIQEQNPQLDPSMYSKIQILIDAGRTDFKNAQTQLLDIRRAYRVELDSVWSGLVLGALGFPRVDLKTFDPVIDDVTEETFKTKRAKPLTIK